MTLTLLSEAIKAIKAKEAMDSAVTDLLQFELIHYGSR